jgi:hypothetical protein
MIESEIVQLHLLKRFSGQSAGFETLVKVALKIGGI